MSGKVLVLLERQAPNSFGATAPQFKSIFAFGKTREATLFHLKNAILDEIEEATEEDPTFVVPKVLDYSENEAEHHRAELASQAESNDVSIVYFAL